MIVAIYTMRQNKEVYFDVWQSKEITNNNSDELNYFPNTDVSINDKTPLAGLHIFGISENNPSGKNVNRNIIIAAELRYKSDNPNCGNGNHAISPCSVFIKKSSGKIEKLGEWPDESVRQQYPQLFTPNYSEVDKAMFYLPNNFFEKDSIHFADLDTMYFNTYSQYECSGYSIQGWQLDLTTGKYTFFGSHEGPIKNDCD